MGYGSLNYGFGEERPFNLAALLMERVNKRFDILGERTIEGNVVEIYRILGVIVNEAGFKFEPEEIKEVDTLLGALASAIRIGKLSGRENMFSSEIDQKIKKIYRLIVGLLYKYELYYPNYKGKTWQEIARGEDI